MEAIKFGGNERGSIFSEISLFSDCSELIVCGQFIVGSRGTGRKICCHLSTPIASFWYGSLLTETHEKIYLFKVGLRVDKINSRMFPSGIYSGYATGYSIRKLALSQNLLERVTIHGLEQIIVINHWCQSNQRQLKIDHFLCYFSLHEGKFLDSSWNRFSLELKSSFSQSFFVEKQLLSSFSEHNSNLNTNLVANGHLTFYCPFQCADVEQIEKRTNIRVADNTVLEFDVNAVVRLCLIALFCIGLAFATHFSLISICCTPINSTVFPFRTPNTDEQWHASWDRPFWNKNQSEHGFIPTHGKTSNETSEIMQINPID